MPDYPETVVGSTSLLIRGGTVVDPVKNTTVKANLLVTAGRIRALISEDCRADRIVDAGGLLVAPGLVDLHVHLREPGGEHKETIATGTTAAVAGGFTAVACMPNTIPPLDSPARIQQVKERSLAEGLSRVYPIACLTRGREGRELTDFAALARAGALAFSDDGDGLADDHLMDAAFEAVGHLGGIIIQHCEDPRYPRGVMHEGAVSAELGLPGMSPRAEEDMIERDLVLAERHCCRYHVAHISTARAVELVSRAKQRGLPVTTEVCPHHLLLTDESCRTLDPDFKMHPPLRSRADIEACIAGVRDGTIDMLVTDHAPHSREEKARGFRDAPAGIIGLETSLALFARALVEPGHLDWLRLIQLMSHAPSRLFGLPGGFLAVGKPADITLIDPNLGWTIDVDQFKSKSRNCPFHGWTVTGRAVCTIVDGWNRYTTPEAEWRWTPASHGGA